MKVAVISDVHGNLSALERVLDDLEHERPDEVVCLGDVAATGPQPRETVQRMRQLDFPTVMGNTDAEMLRPLSPMKVSDAARRVSEIDRWCAGQLLEEDREYLKQFEPTLEVNLNYGNELLCFHGSPLSFNDVITGATPERELDRFFQGQKANLLAGGHTHEQLLRKYGEATIINPGNLGLGSGRAEYAMVESREDGLRLELRSLELPAEDVRRAALHSGMPHAYWWLEL